MKTPRIASPATVLGLVAGVVLVIACGGESTCQGTSAGAITGVSITMSMR